MLVSTRCEAKERHVRHRRPTWRWLAVWWLWALLLLGGSTWMFTQGRLTWPPLLATQGHSMLPTYHPGTLVVLEGVPPASVRVGRVVAIHVPGNFRTQYHYPAIVLHRVYTKSRLGQVPVIRTKGDNNASPEPFKVPVTDVIGAPVLAIPYAGYGLLFLHSRFGLMAVGGLLILWIGYRVANWFLDGQNRGLGTPIPGALALPQDTDALDRLNTQLATLEKIMARQTLVLEELEAALERLALTQPRHPDG